MQMKPKKLSNRNFPKGSVTPLDHEALLWAAEEALTLEPPELVPTFFEIGTHYAGTTRAMVDALMAETKKFRYITCDIHFWNTNPRGENGFFPIDKFEEAKKALVGVYGRDVPVQMIEGIGSKVADQVPDPIMWCFLDGCHCRPCVEAELAAYGSRIAPGGFLLLHDCTEDYRGYPPDQLYHGRPARAFAVIETVEEWEKDHPEFTHVGTTPVKPLPGRSLIQGKGGFFGGTRVLRRKL